MSSSIKKIKKYSQNNNKKKLYQPQPKKLHLTKRIALASSFAAALLCGVALYKNGSNTKEQNTTSTMVHFGKDDFEKLDIEHIEGTTLYRFNSINVQELNELGFNLGDTYNDYDIRCNLLEFASIMGNEEITWDDIKIVVSNNPNIPDRYKTLLYTSCDNLKKSNVNLNLSALKYNLERLEFKSFTDSNLGGIESVTGYFVAKDHAVYVREDLESGKHDKTVLHEIFHGLTTAYANINGRNISCDTAIDVLNIYSNTIEFDDLGTVYLEALTDYVTACALGEQIDCTDSKWSYGFNLYELLMVSDIAGIDLNEYGNNGASYLIDKLSKKGMQNLIEKIVYSDMMYSEVLKSWTDRGLLQSYNKIIYSTIMDIIREHYNNVLRETSDESIARDKAQELLNSYQGYIRPKSATVDGKEYTVITDSIGYGVALEEISRGIDYLSGKTY